ncbi:had superfamily (subfamily iiia) phosphatase [Bacillus pumilus ATCC 7061]|nr:YqeG family HAD IIIA-type phosphatase [Bacillus pumilus]EDW20215.1 had superfamily (subfamily iiia) phosphatase [Bacillus pumilus ATCC 7061]
MEERVQIVLKKYFLPDEFVKSIFHISPQKLKERNVKGIITDLDNTLVEWDRPSATPRLIEWFQEMKDHGIQVTIVSNNNEKRVKLFSEPVHIPFIYKAKKPMGRAFNKAVADMQLKKEDVVVIGDQLMTDVLGGNRHGFHTILVVPVAASDGFITKFNRQIERRILGALKRKGHIQWEEE